MLLKLANRAFTRAVVNRPLSLSRCVQLNKIDADLVNYVEQQLGNDKARVLSSIKGWSNVCKLFTKQGVFVLLCTSQNSFRGKAENQ